MGEKFEQAPNIFYDAIVFITPVVVLSFGVLIGVSGLHSLSGPVIKDIGAFSFVLILVAIIILGYEIGRLFEAISAPLVQVPLKFLNTKRWLLTSEDFAEYPIDVYKTLGLKETVDGRKGDKWVIYIFAYVVNPGIGSDLLKRYAWEKLSRSAACCYLLLTVTSLITHVVNIFVAEASRLKGFGHLWFTATAATLMIACSYEYYRRNAWNYDLLTKVTPVLQESRRLTELKAHPQSGDVEP